jgi:hypothetical protein
MDSMIRQSDFDIEEVNDEGSSGCSGRTVTRVSSLAFLGILVGEGQSQKCNNEIWRA